MTDKHVYVFCGKFEDRETAYLYSEKQWEPEPDESVSDQEYELWEQRNPTHKLKQNIDSYLDTDFIETVAIDFNYLSQYLCNESIERIKTFINNANILVLVFEDALGGFVLKHEPVSNDQLTYCGKYHCVQ